MALHERHHADRIQSTLATVSAAKSALVASWRRSQSLHHLDPSEHRAPQRLTDAELRQARERLEPMLHAAQTSLDRLYHAVGGVGCCVLLADRNGVPVDRRGASVDDETFHNWGLWTGTVWSEDAEGTNGIGTCIVEQRALTIHRDQHFFTRNTLLSCTTAPIYDHEGNLAAALDVSSCRADLTEGFVQLISMAVTDAARRIEADHFRLAYPDARIVVAPLPHHGGVNPTSEALIAVDSDDLVVGATRSARLGLGITPERLQRNLAASDLLLGPQPTTEDLDKVERGLLQRALARADDNVTEAAKALGISRATLHRKLKRYDLR